MVKTKRRFGFNTTNIIRCSKFCLYLPGGRPYPKVKAPRVYTLLKDGYRMDKPKHVDEEL